MKGRSKSRQREEGREAKTEAERWMRWSDMSLNRVRGSDWPSEERPTLQLYDNTIDRDLKAQRGSLTPQRSDIQAEQGSTGSICHGNHDLFF